MPTYEYHCAACGRRYEKREGFDAPARQKCQFCGKGASRVLFAPPIVFKGSGFYKTDSRGMSSASSDNDGGSRTEKKSEASEKKSEPAAAEKKSGSTDTSTTEAAAAS